MRRALVVLPLFVLLSACGSSHVSTAPAISSHAAIWFHPKPTVPSDPLNGSSDFLSLFQTTPTWPIALAHTQVIGLYAGWVANIDDATLQQLVTFLNAHNLTIELESPSLQALSTCGSGVEGYVPYGLSIQAFTASYLGRLTKPSPKRPSPSSSPTSIGVTQPGPPSSNPSKTSPTSPTSPLESSTSAT
jgi:hypothetical protein